MAATVIERPCKPIMINWCDFLNLSSKIRATAYDAGWRTSSHLTSILHHWLMSTLQKSSIFTAFVPWTGTYRLQQPWLFLLYNTSSMYLWVPTDTFPMPPCSVSLWYRRMGLAQYACNNVSRCFQPNECHLFIHRKHSFKFVSIIMPELFYKALVPICLWTHFTYKNVTWEFCTASLKSHRPETITKY